jgi:hypothetical protein
MLRHTRERARQQARTAGDIKDGIRGPGLSHIDDTPESFLIADLCGGCKRHGLAGELIPNSIVVFLSHFYC